jgi:hypothetical protein
LFSVLEVVRISSFSVEPTREYVDDRHEVFSEFLFWGTMLLVTNEEIRPVVTTEPLDELGAKPRKPVFVHDHNLPDQSLRDLFQKPRKTFPFVVEA